MNVSIENKQLKVENELLSKRLSALEQYSRVNNVEIKSVPSTQGDNCLAVVQPLVIGLTILRDTDAVHRVPARKDTNLIARFCSRAKRSEFAAKTRKARLTTSAMVFLRATTSQLPAIITSILATNDSAQAFELKKGKGWKHLWTDNCGIKARKSNSSRVYRINGVMDLANHSVIVQAIFPLTTVAVLTFLHHVFL